MALLLAFLCTGCEQVMRNQPAPRPLQKSSFFSDGRASRPLVPGTVARGHLNEDTHLHTGKTGETTDWSQAAGIVAAQDPFVALSIETAGNPYADSFPFPLTKEVLDRGRQRFDIFCSMCHDRTGGGDGIVVQRGFTKPPSLHLPRLRAARDGYLFDVITRGFGAMPDYSGQIKTKDRWAIVAYVRALQLSQDAAWEDVPPAEKIRLAGGARD